MRVIDSTKQNNFPYIIGVSGGSGSGKTFFAQALKSHLGDEQCTLIFQDNYYIDQSRRFDFDGGSVNFDHPDSIDFNFMAENLKCLKSHQPAFIPSYDFVTHTRSKQSTEIRPTKIIIIDGILIFHSDAIRHLLSELIFFDTPEELRFARRLNRDVQERGREPMGVRNQFITQVKPMHDQYVAPSKKYAHKIVVEMNEYESVLLHYKHKLNALLSLE